MSRFVVIAALCCSFPFHCSHTITPEKKPPAIFLTGKVLDKDGRPVANALARLSGKGLKEVTDLNGVYTIIDSSSAGVSGAERTAAKDKEFKLISIPPELFSRIKCGSFRPAAESALS